MYKCHLLFIIYDKKMCNYFSHKIHHQLKHEIKVNILNNGLTPFFIKNIKDLELKA